MSDLKAELSASAGNAKIVYFLYLASLVVGITGIVGVIMAYMNRSDAEPWLQSHYTYQIRTFWIGVLYSFISFFFVFIVIGYFLLLAVAVWMIVRCIKGLKFADKNEAIPDENSWGF